MIRVVQGDCLECMKELESNSVDAVVTDPPYGIGFMGKQWDKGVPSVEFWAEMLRVLKPGGHLLAFSGTRTYHRMAVAIEDAGFEVRDMVSWIYGSGFPKSLNIGKAIDKLNGRNTELYNEVGLYIKQQRNKKGYTLDDINKFCDRASIAGLWESQTIEWVRLPTMKDWVILKEKLELDDRFDCVIEREEKEREKVGEKDVGYVSQEGAFNEKSCGFKKGTINITKGTSEWEGWGTALKPAHEPICMARKPLSEKTVAENCLKWGTGGLNIDASRVDVADNEKESFAKEWDRFQSGSQEGTVGYVKQDGKYDLNQNRPQGRFPANLIHDNSEEVRECFPKTKSTGGLTKNVPDSASVYGKYGVVETMKPTDSGNASRFFKSIIYQAKASKSERNKGCEGLEVKQTTGGGGMNNTEDDVCGKYGSIKAPANNNHPTVKPVALMEYLINMVSRDGATILDPFMGSGTTGVACKNLGRNFIGIELDADYIEIAMARIEAAAARHGAE